MTKKLLNSGLIFKTKINLKTSILFIILSLNSEINAFELKPYEAKYLASKFGLEITGTRKLEKIDTNKYKISMKTNFLWFKLYESSEFILTGKNKIVSLKYEYKSTGKNNKNIKMTFDRENSILRKYINGDKVEHSFKENVYDRLSYQEQMRLELINNPDINYFKYRVLDHNKTSEYIFLKKEDNSDDKSIKVFERKKEDRSIKISFSAKNDYIPEVFLLKKDGEEQTIFLQKITNPKP
tara:strand:- start:88 stop:804 length:717 start_codon:yes stop_codon:yes gene_type:complete